MGILSLKRLVLHNYEKFNLILGEKYEQELDYLQFNDDTELTYREDSTDGESTESYEKQFDTDGHVLQKLKELVAFGERYQRIQRLGRFVASRSYQTYPSIYI
jgi:hypothetical protein